MSRLDYLTIGIVALCIAALIYLVYRYVNLPHPAENTSTTTMVETDSTEFKKDDTTGFPAEDASDNNKPGPGAVVEPEPEVVPEEKTPIQPKTEKPVTPEPKPTAPVIDNSTSEMAGLSAGRYMVIGGSFEQVDHAQKELRKIQKAGYPNARVEKFNRGAYASILVERFEQASDASALAKALKSKGFDAMVLVKK